MSVKESYMGNGRTSVSNHMLNHGLVKDMLEALKEFEPYEYASRPVPGMYYTDTVSKDGFSFRVYTPRATNKSLSIVAITNGRDEFIVQSAEKYRSYLDHLAPEKVDKWINFLETDLKAPISRIDYNKRISIPLGKFRGNFDKFIDAIKGLI